MLAFFAGPRFRAAFVAFSASLIVLALVFSRLRARQEIVVRAEEPVPAPPAAPAPPPRKAAPSEPFSIAGDGGRPVNVYPPVLREAAAPLLVMLHGAGNTPSDVCDFWSPAARATSWLVCPAGNAAWSDAYDWTGPTDRRIASAEASLGLFDASSSALVDPERPAILIGFSRGAFLARDWLYAGTRRFRGVIFLGAAVHPEVAKLKEAGIERVVFACGDYDGARPTMEAAARRTSAGGVPARFVRLGPIPHALPANLGTILEREIAWVRGEAGT